MRRGIASFPGAGRQALLSQTPFPFPVPATNQSYVADDLATLHLKHPGLSTGVSVTWVSDPLGHNPDYVFIFPYVSDVLKFLGMFSAEVVEL